MALSRKFLTALGIEADKIDEIIMAHAETVDALKEERDNYKKDAEKLEETKKKLDTANEKLEEYGKEDSYKVKYEGIKDEFAKFKKDLANEKEKESKTEAFKGLLKEIGVSEKRIDSIVKVSGGVIDSLKVEDGKIADSSDLIKSLKDEWSDFIVSDGGKAGADVSNPPASEGAKVKTMEEITKIKDTTERQEALKQYLLAKED